MPKSDPPRWSLSVRTTSPGCTVVVLEVAGVALELPPDEARALAPALEEVAEEALMRAEAERDYQKALEGAKQIRGSTAKAGRSLAPKEWRALFSFCLEEAGPVIGARDSALLALLYGGGLRRGEAIRVDVPHYNAGVISPVFGKGKRERTAYLEDAARAAVDDWLAVRAGADVAAEEPLLLSVRKGGAIQPKRLTPRAVGSRKRGRPSNRQLPGALRRHAMELVRAQYADFGPTLAAEKLSGRHDVRVSVSTVRRGWPPADRRLRPRVVRGPCGAVHASGVRGRRYESDHGASLCAVRVDLQLLRGHAELFGAPR